MPHIVSRAAPPFVVSIYHCLQQCPSFINMQSELVFSVLQFDLSLSSQQYKPVTNWSALKQTFQSNAVKLERVYLSKQSYLYFTSNLIRPPTEHDTS